MPERRVISAFRSVTLVLCAAAAFGAELLAPEPEPKNVAPLPMAVFNFDQDALGKPPPRFRLVVTGEGSGVHWEVARDLEAPSAPNILVQKGQAKPGENFALALLDDLMLDHGEVAVRFKALSGEGDQTAGIVFRYKDPQNYYIIVANSREDACALYRVKKGKRKLLDTKDVIVTPFLWHELRITFAKGTYTALMGKELVLGGKHSGLTEPGLVGLWTKCDSQIAFDDFRVSK